MKITYSEYHQAWQGYKDTLKKLIKESSLKRICEVGGGANPALPIEYIRDNGLNYTLLDISRDELEKAPSDYNKMTADICNTELKLNKKFDLIFSKMLMEHVIDAEIFHKNIYNLLNTGGIAFHFFSTLYALPFVLNRLIPEGIASFLRNTFTEKRPSKHRKFPAYYSWCKGPTKRQIKRYKEMKYDILEYKGFFGHEYYRKIPIVKKAHLGLTNFFLRHPSPYFTSFAYLILKKT